MVSENKIKKTHKIIVNKKETIFLTYEQAKNIYKQKEGGDFIIMKNEETLLHRKFYSREVELIPLDEIEKIIQNIEAGSVKHEAIQFLDLRKEQNLFITPMVLEEFLEKKI
jgi:hypothetical protein